LRQKTETGTMDDDVIEFMAIAWECRDEDEHYFVEIFGRMADGAAVCVTCATYQPYLYVQAGTSDHIAGSAKKEGRYAGKCIRSGSTVIFEKLSFSSLRRRRGFARKAEDRGLKTWEAQLDPKYRILHDLGVTSTGWMRVRGFTQVDPDYEEQLKVSVPFLTPAHVQAVDRHDIAPIRLVSYDIETYSHDGRFPLPTVAENVITHVALTEEVYGDSGPRRKVCFCLCPEGVDWCPEEVSVRVCSSERDLLAALCKTVAEWDPDIFLAYNNYGFDNAYLEERMAKVDVPCSLGRDPRLDSRLREIMLSTKQKGKFVLQVLEMHGRINLDVMAVLKNEKQLNSYALNAACSDLLKGQADNQKHDVTPAEMFRAFREKDIPALTTVALYCMWDTELPLRLMGALKVVPNYVEMTRATLTHLSCILTRGQQIRVYSLLVKEANRLGYHVKDEPKEPKEAPVESREDDEEETRATGYQGATVLAPTEGAYYDPVVALDFASLYPSIMRAHNMCYSTLVEPHAVEYVRGQGVEVQEFSGVFFRQTPRGVLPQVLENLARYRKEAKRMMAQHEGTPLEAIYNGKQLAYKVVMNSAYGFTGVQAGFLPEMRIAKSVTYRGRKMLEETKATVEANFYGSSVIYGDSVSGNTPLLLRRGGGEVFIARIESVTDKWSPAHDGKESGEVVDLESWTDEGWTRVHRVIRHALAPEKKMVRVTTHTGVVTCTDDHSLLRHNGLTVSPTNLKVKDILLTNNVPEFTDQKSSKISEDLAWVMGLFMADGSCGVYDCPSGQKSSWAINKRDIALLETARTKLVRSLGAFSFTIMDTRDSSGVYKLSPRFDVKGSVKGLCLQWREMLYSGPSKVVPTSILNASKEVRQAFFEGLYCGDGCALRTSDVKKGRHCGMIIDQKGQISALSIFILASSLGYTCSVGSRTDKLDIYRVCMTKGKLRKPAGVVKRVDILPWTSQYVYDLTTENHHFQAGTGNLIVHNTDSVMVRFAIDEDLDPEEKVQVAWKFGEEASALCKFPPPNELELEKVYMPYLLYGKKNYAALLWTPDATGRVVSKYVDIKGLSAVKRDTCSYVRSVSRRILDALLTLKMPSVWSTGNVIDMARSAADDLLEGRVGVEELVETRKLGGEDGFDTTYGPAYFVRIWGEMYVNGKGVVKSGHPRWWMPTIDKDGPHAWEDVVGGKLIILRAPGGEDFFDRSILHQTGSRGDAQWIMCEWDRGANAWSNERKRVKECMVLSQYIRSPGTPPHTMTVHETRQSVTVTDPLVPGGKKKEERLKAVFLSPHPPGQEPYVPKDQPAYHVRDAMWRRNPGSEPRPGDRVSFVYVKRPNTKACECAEDPAYAAEVGLEVDRHYYFRNRMKEPVEKLLKLHVGDDMQQVFSKQMSINLSDITDPSDLKHVGCREIKRHVAERTGKAPMSREATFATWMAVKDQSPRQGPPLKKGKTLQGQMSMKNFIPKRG